MRPDLIDSKNLDANETAHFSDQLRYVKSKTYDRKYPEFGLFGNIPISYEVPAHIKEIAVRSYDSTGIAKIIADFSDDLPRADVIAFEDTVKVRTLGDSYGYSIDEVRTASATGSRLDTRKAEAAKRAVVARMNDIAWRARPATHAGMVGLLYTAGIPVSQVPLNQAGTSRKFADKTPDEMIKALNLMTQGMFKLTNGMERADTVLLPMDTYGLVSTAPRSSTSDTTVLDFFLKTNPFVKRVATTPEISNVSPRPSGITSPATTSLAICYKNDPEKLAFEITSQFEQLPAQERGLEFVVPCMAKVGGTCVYYPLSLSFWEDCE